MTQEKIDEMYDSLKLYAKEHGVSETYKLMRDMGLVEIEETGCSLVTKEREEMLGKHNRTVKSDVKHNYKEQLRLAAHKLTSQGVLQTRPPRSFSEVQWDHMTDKPYIERLVYAGAFIMAEIDRALAVKRGTFDDSKTDPA